MNRVFLGAGKIPTTLATKNDLVFGHNQIEVKNIDSVMKVVGSLPRGSKIVNCIAKINLEWCEENADETFAVNAQGAYNVGLACAEHGHHLLHVSSGCIFDGGEPSPVYDEDSRPTPSVVYTRSKTAGDEKLLRLGYDKITIIRPRQLVSAVKYPTNMITKFIRIPDGRYIESQNSLTLIEDMGTAINFLLDKNLYGIYNVANEGYISPFEIATMIKEKWNLANKVSSISYNDYVSSLRVRRVNTKLDTTKLKRAGLTLRTAKEAVEFALSNYGEI